MSADPLTAIRRTAFFMRPPEPSFSRTGVAVAQRCDRFAQGLLSCLGSRSCLLGPAQGEAAPPSRSEWSIRPLAFAKWTKFHAKPHLHASPKSHISHRGAPRRVVAWPYAVFFGGGGGPPGGDRHVHRTGER